MEAIRLQGRLVSSEDLALVRALIAAHPDWHRTALSLHLCELWNWRNGAGQLKDMAARTLLLKLQARGLIQLPAARSRTRRPCAQAPPPLPSELLRPELIQGELKSLRPIQLQLADCVVLRRRIAALLAEYHYRGFHGAVGENAQYLARDRAGRELAVMVFGAAAWKVAVRDRFIGWSDPQRAQRLAWVANQQRFLILPWVRIAHLASHLIALATGRLSEDWRRRYAHPICLAESFVETDRFAGAAYKAAGWTCLGQTTGRTRQDRHHTFQTPPKTVWVRALHPQFRELLLCHEAP